MSRNISQGYGDSNGKAERQNLREAIAEQRTEDFKTGLPVRGGGVVDPLPEDAPDFVADYYDYYKTDRGYHPRSLNSNDGWNVTGTALFLNAPLLAYSGEIDSAVMLVHGEAAHSYTYSEVAFEKLQGDNKQFISIPDASHTDLYDQKDIIPFDKIEAFYKQHM